MTWNPRRLAYHVALARADETLEPWMSEPERAAHDRLAPRRRADWRAGRLAAKRALRATGIDSPFDRLVITSGRGRAPAAALRVGERRESPLAARLSIAHCDGHGAAGAAPAGDARIGVDLERWHDLPAAHLRCFATARERGMATLLGASALWALKEAAWKALGCDATLPFTALELEFAADGTLRAVGVRGVEHSAHADLSRPWAGFVLGVVLVEESPS